MKTWHFEFDITLSRARAEELLEFLSRWVKIMTGKDAVIMFTEEGKE